MQNTFLRVLVVDSQPVFRDGLCDLLDSFSDIQVVGRAASSTAALDLVLTCAIDVVVADHPPHGIGDADLLHTMVRRRPTVGVLILAGSTEDQLVIAAIRAGVRGYLSKNSDPVTLVRALRAVAGGEAVFGPEVARQLAGYFSAGPAAWSMPPFPQLTKAERAVLDLVATGLPNVEIAKRLFVSPKTVRNRISVIFQKLQVSDRPSAIVRAREAGMGVVPR